MVEEEFNHIVEDSFDDKMQYIKQNINIDPYINGADLIKIVSLLCFIVTNNRKKVNPDYSVKDAVNLVCSDTSQNAIYEYFKERLPLICEPFLQDASTKFDTYNLKSRDEILTETKRLMDQWIPF